ncbi:MAG: DUF4339 domain-containing protein [Acidobacteriaceae bacterium]|nr:DUF4339 domain-containing protein [Acidobacteriaceae bacterium]
MNYRIKRDEQEYGPYSLTELQSYVKSGHIAATDIAQSEGMSDWVPVQQILGDLPMPAMVWAGGNGTGMVLETGQQLVPLPPNLHWGWVLALNALTRGLFSVIWVFVQANWTRKLSGKNTSIVLAAMYPAGLLSGGIAFAVGEDQTLPAVQIIGGVLLVAGVVCNIMAAFRIGNAMETYYNSVENIGLRLSGGMIFFFQSIYLQFHINRITRWKRTGELSS